MEFTKRIGPDPHQLNSYGVPDKTPNASGCPDVWELDNGDIAVIGRRETTNLSSRLPLTAGCGPDEEIVVLPRYIVLNALNDLMELAAK